VTIIETVPFWSDEPEVWDTCVLGHITLPGVSDLRITRKQTISREKGSGTSGETLKFQGPKAADVIIRNRIHTPEQLAELSECLPELEPVGSKKDGVVWDLGHPKATIRGVKTVVVELISGPDPVGNGGEYETTFQCIEQRKPEPKPVSTAKGGNGPLTLCQGYAIQLEAAKVKIATAATAEDFLAANNELMGIAVAMQSAGCGETPPSAEVDAFEP
jgi:hypothetical protein